MSGPVETQPERTVLAWQRTGLGVLGVAAVIGRAALTAGRPALLVVAGVVALLGLGGIGGVAPLRYRRLRAAATTGVGAGAPRPVAAAVAVVCLVAVAGVGAVLVTR